ncbi:MAG: hypothetical protein Q9M33_06105 [Robiginitomaculum sp.]|nr:hypothetical protein [Robiginitomaculum sp.]MDQ7078387.1 hypothetical protein [Robiginitomaculum sp.]
MGRTRADKLIEQYGKFSPMSMNEAGALAKKMFADTPASREEAEILLGACGLFEPNDRGWRHLVSQEIRRHLLDHEEAAGTLPDGAEDWLIATLATLQVPSAITLELVQSIMLGADNATQRLGRIGLRSALTCMKSAAREEAQHQASTALG